MANPKERDVVLRRSNNRFVKVLETVPSRYSAKQSAEYWRRHYDDTYKVVIESKKG